MERVVASSEERRAKGGEEMREEHTLGPVNAAFLQCLLPKKTEVIELVSSGVIFEWARRLLPHYGRCSS